TPWSAWSRNPPSWVSQRCNRAELVVFMIQCDISQANSRGQPPNSTTEPQSHGGHRTIRSSDHRSIGLTVTALRCHDAPVLRCPDASSRLLSPASLGCALEDGALSLLALKLLALDDHARPVKNTSGHAFSVHPFQQRILDAVVVGRQAE